MRETAEQQLERVRVWSRFPRKKLKQFSGLDIEALRAVLDQLDRLRAALRAIQDEVDEIVCCHDEIPEHGVCVFCWIRSKCRAAIHPETPVEETEQR